MNNNGNFNNNGVKPLFGNDFNNVQENPNGGSAPFGYQNFSNGLQQTFQNPNGYQGQPVNSNNPFENSFNFSSPQPGMNTMQAPNNMNLNLEQPNLGDIPPELGEIKNLNEATVASAPTMEVLDPMNVMPEATKPSDPLDNYENGLNNFNNAQPLNTSVNNLYQGVSNQVQSPAPTELFQGYTAPNGNFGLNNNIPNNQPLNSFAPQMSNPVTELPQFNNITTPIFNNNDNFNLNSQQSTNNFASQNEPNQYTRIDEIKPLSSVAQDALNSAETQLEEVAGNINDVADNKVETQDLNDDYTIVQDENLNKSEQSVSTLSDLGIENTYDEPDTLDIIDDDNNEESSDNGEESGDNGAAKQMLSVSDTVSKIKELIEELKESGANIELEEFDFEQMQQLIIKIDK